MNHRIDHIAGARKAARQGKDAAAKEGSARRSGRGERGVSDSMVRQDGSGEEEEGGSTAAHDINQREETAEERSGREYGKRRPYNRRAREKKAI